MRSNRPYVQLDPAVIEQARQMDLLSYLQRYEPNNLKRVASNVHCTKCVSESSSGTLPPSLCPRIARAARL